MTRSGAAFSGADRRAAADATGTREPLLSIEGLTIDAVGGRADLRLVEDVTLSIARGEVLGLVGESGCGKSITALSVLRILPPPLTVASGRMLFEDQDLLKLDDAAMRGLRGNRIGMVFQEPMTSLNPTFTVGWQLSEALRLHGAARGPAVAARAAELLSRVGIAAPERRLRQYPHELSGGLRQRVVIAMALACDPSLLIADEPTTALDVTIQRQVLDLLGRLRRELRMGILLVTHDLGVVAEYTDRVAVMYAGRIVEQGRTAALLARPRHPYTAGLLAARPSLHGPRGKLQAIPGVVPSPATRGVGCRFADRCGRALDRCRAAQPPLAGTGAEATACWNPLA
jgi:oligopeptide/dipeptide ABC transporter ATP-binding protein